MSIDSYLGAFATPAAISAASGILLLLGCLVWTAVRSGSLHALRYRVWRLVYGKADVQDPELAGFLARQASLMSFRFHSGLGLRVRTFEQMRRLIRWMKEQDEDVAAVRRAGDFFDVETLTIADDKLYDRWQRTCEWLAVVLVFATFVGAVGRIVAKDALIQVRKTDHWIVLSSGAATRILHGSDAEPFVPAMCAADRVAAIVDTGMSAADIDVLCEIFALPAVDAVVDALAAEQRIGFSVLALSLSLQLILFGGMPLRRISATKLHARIRRRPVPAPLELVPRDVTHARRDPVSAGEP